MSDTQVQTFTLVPHTASSGGAVHRIAGRVSRSSGVLRLHYVVEGKLECLRIPAPQSPRFADELWRHTCFEAFIARTGESSYHECNFSPSGEWAAYAFARYRERVSFDARSEADLVLGASKITGAAKLEMEAAVQLDGLSPHYANAALMLGISAVIETHKGALSYWALRHPVAKPDFHHRDSFILELNEIRN